MVLTPKRINRVHRLVSYVGVHLSADHLIHFCPTAFTLPGCVVPEQQSLPLLYVRVAHKRISSNDSNGESLNRVEEATAGCFALKHPPLARTAVARLKRFFDCLKLATRGCDHIWEFFEMSLHCKFH